jgi:hypothetical protein
MHNYKARPEQWAGIEKDSRFELDACILELRARLEALEAQASNYPVTPDSSTPPSVATDEELRDIWDRAFDLRAIYNLGIEHGQARSRELAEPAPGAGGLVERVSDVIGMGEGGDWFFEARAAILEVASWLREQGAFFTSTDLLEQEAGR